MFLKLQELSIQFIRAKASPYKRYFIKREPLTHRLSIILGSRGVGKTTTLIQHLLDQVEGDIFDRRILYIQADHFCMGNASLYEIAEKFHLQGGKWLAIDEIHKYPQWSQELKSIYDSFVDLQLVVSGSSALRINQGSHDLSRRALIYFMHGLSFREFLEMKYNICLPSFLLDQICQNHQKIAHTLLTEMEKLQTRILPEFASYLELGYFPYFFELNHANNYKMTLEQNFHATIEVDLVSVHPQLTGNSLNKIKQLLIYIAESVPFTPNWTTIANLLNIGDVRTLKTYFTHLEDANLVRCVGPYSHKLAKIASGKIYVHNPNQLFVFSSTPNKGTLREIFFLSQLCVSHAVALPGDGDFLVDQTFTFEIGGKRKTFHQIKSEENAFVAADDIEIGLHNQIPLWLFGFLY